MGYLSVSSGPWEESGDSCAAVDLKRLKSNSQWKKRHHFSVAIALSVHGEDPQVVYLHWDDNIEWRPDKQLKFWTYILKSSLKDWEDGYTYPQIIGPAVRHVRPSYWHEMCFCCQNVMCNGQGTLSLLPAQVVTLCASFSAILFKRLDSLIFTVAKLTVVHKQTQVDWFRSMQGGIRSLAR